MHILLNEANSPDVARLCKRVALGLRHARKVETSGSQVMDRLVCPGLIGGNMTENIPDVKTTCEEQILVLGGNRPRPTVPWILLIALIHGVGQGIETESSPS